MTVNDTLFSRCRTSFDINRRLKIGQNGQNDQDGQNDQYGQNSQNGHNRQNVNKVSRFVFTYSSALCK